MEDVQEEGKKKWSSAAGGAGGGDRDDDDDDFKQSWPTATALQLVRLDWTGLEVGIDKKRGRRSNSFSLSLVLPVDRPSFAEDCVRVSVCYDV